MGLRGPAHRTVGSREAGLRPAGPRRPPMGIVGGPHPDPSLKRAEPYGFGAITPRRSGVARSVIQRRSILSERPAPRRR
jgi:hypothetical protein